MVLYRADFDIRVSAYILAQVSLLLLTDIGQLLVSYIEQALIHRDDSS
jgi:hypothetical protein